MDAGPIDEVRHAVAVEAAVAHAAVGQGGVFGDKVDDVHTKAVDAAVQPPAHHRVDRLAYLGVLPVKIGLLSREEVQIVLVRAVVELPSRPGEDRAPVVRLGARIAGAHAVARGPPPVPIALGVVRGGTRLDEPRVFVRGVVDDEVHNELHPALVDGRQQRVEKLQRAERGVDVPVVADIVAGVVLRRRVDRRKPQHVDPQGREVVQPRGDPGEIADTVSVAVREAARPDLIDDALSPPLLPHGA